MHIEGLGHTRILTARPHAPDGGTLRIMCI
jgi:hypothetical protein